MDSYLWGRAFGTCRLGTFGWYVCVAASASLLWKKTAPAEEGGVSPPTPY